jgi:hypothetical protein
MVKILPKQFFSRQKKANEPDEDGERKQSTVERVPAFLEGHKDIPSRNHYGSLWESSSVGGSFGFVRGTHHARTYSVTPSHEKTENGVKFNVEDLPKPEKQDKRMKQQSRAQVLDKVAEEAGAFYKRSYSYDAEKKGGVRLEAVSDTPKNLVFAGGHGFFAACITAFAKHLPLSLDANDIWTVIMYAFSKHVETHAEELRSNFVSHQGKKALAIEIDHFKMSSHGKPDTGTPAKMWEKDVFPKFSEQIKDHIGAKVHSIVTRDFSTSNTTSRAVSELALMSAMKSYFSYEMSTCCGIPSIELRGNRQDWLDLRTRTEELGQLMTQRFSGKWLPVLLPILDEFVASYDGNVNHDFWQTFVKLRGSYGSGGHEEISGWIQNFFPYLDSGYESGYIRPWQETYFSGPRPRHIPAITASCPVLWKYYGQDYDLHFFSGFSGFCQDNNGMVYPALGWAVAHDPDGLSDQEGTVSDPWSDSY